MKSGNPRVDNLIAQMTLDEKLLLVHGQILDPYRANQAGYLAGCPRLGIPPLFIADGESGINTSWEATSLPAKTGLAASFDVDTAKAYGRVLGEEARDSGMHVVLSPRVNIVRAYVAPVAHSNGGNYQTYSEDPLLNGLMGAAEAQGIQQDNNAIANLKQIFGSSSGTAQGAGNCIIDEQTMHEIYLKPFEYVTRAGVGSNMTNYNQVNGTWTYKYTDVTQKLCRDAWGFQGFTIDDWYCLYEPEAIKGGVTLEMPGEDYCGAGSEKSWYGKKLKDAILDPANPVTEDDLDLAVGYLLCAMDRFRMLDEPRTPGPVGASVKYRSAAFARTAAQKAAVLLKNKGNILPLDLKRETIAVIGPTGRQQAMPIFKEAANGFDDRKTGAWAALQARTEKKVLYAVGDDLQGSVIPATHLKSRDGNPGCVNLDIALIIYDTLGNDSVNEPMKSAQSLGTVESVCFTEANALPAPRVGELDGSGDKRKPAPYYMVTGKICAPETGAYRVSLQSRIPTTEEFEQHHVTAFNMQTATSGNLYIKEKAGGIYERIAIGTRTGMNGGAVPNSEVVPCLDGYNNAGGEVYLEKGGEYDFIATSCSIYGLPVHFRLCWVTPSMREQNEREAVSIASKSDKALVFAWHHSPNEKLQLHENQNTLIEKVCAANPNTVIVLNNGDPVAMPWLDRAAGVLEMWYSGQEGGQATADVLTGVYNPAGRLPVTFPRHIEDSAVHDPKHPERLAMAGRGHSKDHVADNVAHFTEGILMGYRHFDKTGVEPLFPFGYGLSYTSFAYLGMTVSKKDSGLRVNVTVRNTGRVFGDEVVQCYLSPPANTPAGAQFCKKSLAAFARMGLDAGETRTVELTVDPQSLCYWKVITENGRLDEGEGWQTLCGRWTVLAGPSSGELPLKDFVEI
jgi:beta-glucosidase